MKWESEDAQIFKGGGIYLPISAMLKGERNTEPYVSVGYTHHRIGQHEPSGSYYRPYTDEEKLDAVRLMGGEENLAKLAQELGLES